MLSRFSLVFLSLVFGFLFSPEAISQDTEVPIYRSAADIPMETFAQLPKIEKISLSPDGQHLAIVYPIDGEAKFVIFDLAMENPEPPVIIPTGDADIRWIKWVNENRILINFGYYTKTRGDYNWYETRMMSFDRDGENGLEVGKWEGSFSSYGIVLNKRRSRYFINTDDVLSFLPDNPEHILVQVKIPGWQDLGVYKINVYTDEMTQVQAPMEPVTTVS